MLKDLGLVTESDTKKLIDKCKLRRERKKWGKKLEFDERNKPMPHGLYLDGKKVETLVRETTETEIQRPGQRGRAAKRTVSKTCNKIVIQDHYPIVGEPGGDYITHITIEEGTGHSIGTALANVIKEWEIDCRYLHCVCRLGLW